MRIIITGAAGFIGSTTACMLSKRHQVLALDNFSTGRTSNLQGFHGKIEFCDVIDQTLLERLFSDFLPDAVLHLAAQSAISTSMTDPVQDARVNILGTINVAEACRKYKTGRLVFSSTSAVYSSRKSLFPAAENFSTQPDSPYGIAKLSAEHYIRTIFPNHVIFRYGNVYGPKQNPIGENQVVARAMKHFVEGDGFFVTGDGNQKRDFIYVDDVADANIQALMGEMKGTYNLCTGKSHSVNEVLRQIELAFAVPGYPLDHTKKNDPRGSVYLSNGKAKKDFILSPLSLHDGIKKTAVWWKDK